MKTMSAEKLTLSLCVISINTVFGTEWKLTIWTSGDKEHDVEQEEYKVKNLQVIKQIQILTNISMFIPERILYF